MLLYQLWDTLVLQTLYSITMANCHPIGKGFIDGRFSNGTQWKQICNSPPPPIPMKAQKCHPPPCMLRGSNNVLYKLDKDQKCSCPPSLMELNRGSCPPNRHCPPICNKICHSLSTWFHITFSSLNTIYHYIDCLRCDSLPPNQLSKLIYPSVLKLNHVNSSGGTHGWIQHHSDHNFIDLWQSLP